MPRNARIALCAALAMAVGSASFASPANAAAAGRLEGLLVGVDGRAASGYTLHVIDRDGRDIGESATTDEGVYSFPALPSGSYSLGVEGPDGRMAVVDAPPVRIGRSSLARRDVRLMEADPSRRDGAVDANPSVGLWWAGLSPKARAWSVVGMVFFVVITVAALSNDDDDDDFRELDATPVTMP